MQQQSRSTLIIQGHQGVDFHLLLHVLNTTYSKNMVNAHVKHRFGRKGGKQGSPVKRHLNNNTNLVVVMTVDIGL